MSAVKDASGHFLPGHEHAHYLPTSEGDDRRRLTHLTVWAPRGFDDDETAALAGLRRWAVGDLRPQAQLVGLGRPADFRAPPFGGPAGASAVWASATPYVGPAHVGRRGRERSLRKAIRRELRRWALGRGADVEVAAVEAIDDGHPAWSGRPRPLEFVRGRRRPGDDGYRRPTGTFRLTLSSPMAGPLCLGYASHYGLGLFLPSG